MTLLQEFELEVEGQKREKEELDRQHRSTILQLQADILEVKQRSKKALRELKTNM
jgi:hypothetical protein